MTRSSVRAARCAAAARALLVVAVLSLTVSPGPAAEESSGGAVPVNVGVGASRLVRFRAGVDRFTVGDSAFAEVKIASPRSLQVTGKQYGETGLMVWDTRGAVTRLVVTVGVPAEGLSARLKQLFPGDQVSAQSSGMAVVLTGTVSDPVTVKRASEVAEAYLAGFKGASGKGGGSARGAFKVLNFVEVAGRQQVQLRVKVAEVSRGALRQMGLNVWARTNPSTEGKGLAAGMLAPGGSSQGTDPGSAFAAASAEMQAESGENGQSPVPILFGAAAAGASANPLGLYFATGGASALPISVALTLLQGRRLAKILSEPTLVAYSGKKAEFLAGGEFPLPAQSALGSASVQFKKFGVQVSFTPSVLSHRTIHLEVSVTVSDRDDVRTVDNYPGITTRSASTTVRLRNGQSFAIAGLLQDQVSSYVAKVPLLGDIPILGALFRQTSFERQERELVMLVTAELVRPLKPGEVPALPGEDEVSDPGAIAFFLLGSIDPELKAERKARPAGPVGYSR